MDEKRVLSDADIKALTSELADELEARLQKRFFQDLGKGVWALIWKAIVILLLAIAAYGTVKTASLGMTMGGRP